MIYRNKKINFYNLLKNFQVHLWKSGLRLAWQKRLMHYRFLMTAHRQGNQSLIKTFYQVMILLWQRWLWSVVKLIKREPRSLKVSPSIRTEAGFMLRSTKCVRIKEEQ